jgi:integrase
VVRSWRLEPKKKPSGTYYVLVAGRDRERVSISLKYVTEAEAAVALVTIRQEEEKGTISRIIALHEENPEAAIKHLVGDPGVAELLPAPATDYGSMTLQEYYDAVYAPWRAADRPKSWRSERGHWGRILRELGPVKVRKIDAHVVADYMDGLRVEREGDRKGEVVSGTTKRLHRNALQQLLNRAERQKHIVQAPDLSRFKLRGSTKPVRERPEPLTLEEVVKLLKASAPKHRAMWAVGIGQGLRPSELQRLCWEHVRWEERTLDIPGEKTEESAATVPLTPLAYRELHAWWEKQEQPAEGVMFPSKKYEGKVVPYATVSGYRKALAAAAEAAGISKTVNPYLLRASFATLAWSLGIEKDVARRVLRHVDERMLDEVYCRPRPKDLVERVSAFDL